MHIKISTVRLEPRDIFNKTFFFIFDGQNYAEIRSQYLVTLLLIFNVVALGRAHDGGEGRRLVVRRVPQAPALQITRKSVKMFKLLFVLIPKQKT